MLTRYAEPFGFRRSALVRIANSEVFAFALGVLACLLLAGMGTLRYGEPLSLSGDHLFVVVQAKNFLMGGGVRFNKHLGFPGVQDNLLFPQFEASYRAILYVLSRLTGNVFLILGWFYAICIALMFSFSYLSFRKLSVRPWIASCASAAYVVSPFLALRAVGHDYLALYFGVPLGATLALLAGQAATQRELRSVFLSWFGILAIVVAGTSGLYYAFFTAMFLMVTLSACGIGHRSPFPVLVGAGACALILGLVVLSGYGMGIVDVLAGRIPQPQRYAVEQLSYGLLISDALHVYRDIGLFVSRFAGYESALRNVSGANYLFEWPGPILTTIILFAPLAVLSPLFAREPSGRIPVLIWLAFGLITFGMIFATRGGLGFIFNYLVMPSIRAPARIVPFLSFFALAVFCVGLELTLARWRGALMTVIAAALCAALVAGSWPAVGVIARVQRRYLDDPASARKFQSIQALLSAKDRAGLKAVLQLPALKWPEVGPQLAFDPYQHELPYILDRNDSNTRWSYGISDLQPEFGVLAAVVRPNVQDAAGLSQRAKGLGFDGILVEKSAYAAPAATSLIETIASEVGALCSLYADESRVLFALTRSVDGAACEGGAIDRPTPPMDFEFTETGNGRNLLGSGWGQPGPRGTWAIQRRSSLTLPVPERPKPGQAILVTIKAVLFRPEPAQRKVLRIASGKTSVHETVVEPNKPAELETAFLVGPDLLQSNGTLDLVFDFQEPQSVPGSPGEGKLGIGLQHSRIEIVDAPR